MNFTKINENSELLNADENQKKAIFAMIDLKTDQNMKEVILEFRKMDARFDALQSRLSTLEKLVWGLLYGFATTIVTTIIIAIVNKFF